MTDSYVPSPEAGRWIRAMMDPDRATLPKDAQETLVKIVAGIVDDCLNDSGNIRDPALVEKTVRLYRGLCADFAANPKLTKDHIKWRALPLSGACVRLPIEAANPATKAWLRAWLQTGSPGSLPS